MLGVLFLAPERSTVSGRALDAADVVRTVIAAARDEDVTFLAAAVAYYGFVSLVPLALLSVALATLAGGPALADRVVGTLEQFLTPEAQGVVRDALTQDSGRGAATFVGLVTFLWGALKVFRGLDRAFSRVYGSDEVDSLVGAVRNATVALAAIGGGVLAVALVDALVRRILPDLPTVAAVFGTTTLLATLVAALFPLYYLFPGVRLSPREALPGTVFAAVGWTLLELAFSAYVAVVGASSVYGLLGGALLLVTWLYFGAVVVILGAVVNATLSGRGRPPGQDRQLQHPPPRQPRPDQMPRGDDTGSGDGATRSDADATGSDPDGTRSDPGPTVSDADATRNQDAGSARGDSGADDGSGGPPVTDGGRPPDDDAPDEDGETTTGEDEETTTNDEEETGDGETTADEVPSEEDEATEDTEDVDDTGADDGSDEDVDGTDGDDGSEEDDDDTGAEDGSDEGREVDGPDHFWEPETEDVGDRSAGDDGDADDAGPAEGDDAGAADGDEAGAGDGDGGDGGDPGGWREGGEDPRDRTDAGFRDELDRLWEDLEELETHVQDKTVSRSSLESELRSYVRWRVRRGHARGWGPYLVLLYGTVMTLGAFYYLDGIYAILAMIVLWLSTLGLYTLMIIVGAGIGLLRVVAKARGLLGGLRRSEE